MALHERTHYEERPFACSQCSYRANSKTDLNRHESSNHFQKIYSSQIRPKQSTTSTLLPLLPEIFSCSECLLTTESKDYLKLHVQLMHSTTPIQETLPSPSPSFNIQKDLHSCSECSFSTAHKGGLKTHERTHVVERPHSELLRHELLAENEVFTCIKCLLTTESKDYLKLHLNLMHSGDEPSSSLYGSL